MINLDALKSAATLFSDKLSVDYHNFSDGGPDEYLCAFLMDGDAVNGSIICVDEEPDPHLDEMPSPRLHAIADIVNAIPALLAEVERLREALVEIAERDAYFGEPSSEYKSIARQALNLEGPDDHL